MTTAAAGMKNLDLARTIEETKRTVLGSIRKHLPAELHASVEDVAQETYLRYFLAYRGKPALDGDSIHKWLYVAAKNEALRAARKHRRAGFSLLRFLQGFRAEQTEPSEETPSAEKLASGLPLKYREAAMLRLAGLDVAAIAKRLRIAPGTVKSRLSRGRELMQRMAANEREAQ